MLNDPLANVMSMIDQFEKIGRKECTIHPASSLILGTLKILQDEKYLGETVEVTPKRGGVHKVQLIGQVNKCGVIKPRFPLKSSAL